MGGLFGGGGDTKEVSTPRLVRLDSDKVNAERTEKAQQAQAKKAAIVNNNLDSQSENDSAETFGGGGMGSSYS